MIGLSDENGPQGSGIEDDGASFTLNCTDRHGVLAFAQNTRDEVRIQEDGTISGALSAQPGMKQTTYVCETGLMKTLGTNVRRLTPKECERLQGFPDDWTKIPYRGKPADECPDGPRYKAIGNSMAVPVMRWIGERIAMADAGDIS